MTDFELHLDDQARAYLAAHPAAGWVIAYDVHRCCGGGVICQVRVRKISARDRRDELETAVMFDGTTVLVDSRAARRLPARFGLTVRGLGPLRHLDLELSGEQWGELLYS
ncbi:MAG: hypothetical protein E6I61_14040 [Chloroflexi bacterium]|nr:MAG: hypothetical protein E6J08_10590 [Chloroflexota bacterium]TME02555.1 MAG: hypothetical protein E6I71_13105 [Chloroflexota bacterium]TME37828.1 MAG: hypothetical protein E6I61_14040 [Chloroflexota bacterium]TME51960.1 MAG: hypothetical protein E6I53_08075 [Chloroflexota bacterium]